MITLKKRARRITKWIRGSFDYAVVAEDFEEKCRSTILKNLQHVKRDTLLDVLTILSTSDDLVQARNRVREL